MFSPCERSFVLKRRATPSSVITAKREEIFKSFSAKALSPKIPFPIHTSDSMLFLTVNSLKEAQENQDLPSIKGLELRLDRFEAIDIPTIAKLQENSPLPLLFTLRSVSQGGSFHGTEKERFTLIEQLLALKPAFFDLEHDTPHWFLEKMAKEFPKTQRILSYHNFEEHVDVEKILSKIHSPYVSFYKIACHAASSLDALRLATSIDRKNLCAIAMGRMGEISRILSPITGNCFNFACRKEDLSPAGQLSVETLQKTYNYSRLTPSTSIFALLGDPVEMSPSHRTHNRVFNDLGMNAVYLKILLKSSELGPFFSEMRKLPFRGFSVTMPHKEAVLPFLDEISEEARAMRAVNTILVKDGKLYGTNTDGAGALDAIEKRIRVRKKKILLLGAGGTARAIAYEAVRRGANLTILNRTKEDAEALARGLNCNGAGLEEISKCADYSILINATSVGMQEEKLPCDSRWILPRTLIMETIMRPTPLLKEAEVRGCTPLPGSELFIEQAAKQFAFWIPEVDLERVKGIIRRYLSA